MERRGGARARSGPAPDPNAMRRDRKDDAEWTILPVEGFQGEVPAFPLSEAKKAEFALWDELWAKPQAFMWAKLDLKYEVAAYVRAFLESTTPGAVNGLKNAARSMAAEIGLSLPGMHSLRWKFAEDELGERRSAPTRSGSSVKDRLKAIQGG